MLFFIFNAIKIYVYASNYEVSKSDVAIVLGAGTDNGVLSPIFKERINHAIYLYNNKIVSKIIFTGGTGEGQLSADSEIAKQYAIECGLPKKDLLLEVKSNYTDENLLEAHQIMMEHDLHSALIVSDPLHMKRSMDMATSIGINCLSSPTQTSMYRSFYPKFKSLLYETFFYSMGKLTMRF